MSVGNIGPVMIIIAGPNGSGKSTATRQFSRDGYEVIDPDRIARNLSPDSPRDYSIAAGRQAIKEALNESILNSSERAAVKMRFSPCFKINDLRH